MTRLFSGLTIGFGVVLTLATEASADPSPNDISISTFNPEDAVAPASSVEGPGIQIGEGTVLHPVFGIETGYISNVFYQDKNTQPAGVLRLIAQIGAASLGSARLSPSAMDPDTQTNLGEFEYRANLRLSYDLIFAGNNDATARDANNSGGLGVGASLKGIVHPMGTFAFGFDEDFQRLIRAANYETDANTNRDINNIQLNLLYQPRDSAINGYLYYRNMIDVFERSQNSFVDRWSNIVGLHPQWRFAPESQVYLDLSWGAVTPLSNSNTKGASYPLTLRAGIATLLTLKTTLNIDAGYSNGFYSAGPSFSAPVVGASVGYRYSPLGRAALGYMLQYADSINSNYYRDHIIYGTLQQLVNPLVFMIQPELHFREYSGVNSALPTLMGPDTRDDVIISVIAGFHYNFRNWFAATLDYRFTSVQTDYRYTAGTTVIDDPSYVRHEILAGVRVAM